MPLLERGRGTQQVMTFPNDPLFKQILNHATESNGIIIYDPDRSVEATYAQLLCDISMLRQAIYEQIPESMRAEHMAISGQRPYICILASCSYELMVAFFTTIALGGAAVPMCCILATPEHLGLAHMIQENSKNVAVVPLDVEKPTTPLNIRFQIDEKLVFSPSSPGALFFTSGTTGPPKGVVHKRSLFYLTPSERRYNERYLSYRPVEWMGSCSAAINCILRGIPIEIFRSDGRPELFWERFRKGGVTMLSGPPVAWLQLMEYYQEKLVTLPPDALNEYIQGVRGIHAAQMNAALASPSVVRFWERMLGRALKIMYTGTEMGGKGIGTTSDTDLSLERCIGMPASDVSVKLSGGDHGEILMKAPSLFSHYLNDEASTRAAFDDEGFYKTGDEAHRVGDLYFIDGRVSTDIIRFYGFKTLVLEIESAMMELSYISEAYALSISDFETGDRVSALVWLKTSQHGGSEKELPGLTLEKLRMDLSTTLSTYKLPTLLRILHDGEEAPKTVSSKIAKKQAIQKYFFRSAGSADTDFPAQVQVWDVRATPDESRRQKPWDWCGLTHTHI